MLDPVAFLRKCVLHFSHFSQGTGENSYYSINCII